MKKKRRAKPLVITDSMRRWFVINHAPAWEHFERSGMKLHWFLALFRSEIDEAIKKYIAELQKQAEKED